MYPDYRDAVFQEYLRKKGAGILSPGLIEPTPAGLRRECTLVATKRFEKKDMRTLEGFFGPSTDQGSFIAAIEKSETDKFRPLVNYIKGSTKEPDRIIVELLSWLIDFKDRPWEFGRKLEQPDNPAAPPTPPPPGKPPAPVAPVIERPFQRGGKKLRRRPVISTRTGGIISGTLLILIGAVAFWVYYYKTSAHPRKPGGCMYWAEDHYQSIPCDQNASAVPLDSDTLVHLKRITRPDTITSAAIGYVWYDKVSGNLQYYTWSGFDPVRPEYRLKPITSYIIKKYIDTARVVK